MAQPKMCPSICMENGIDWGRVHWLATPYKLLKATKRESRSQRLCGVWGELEVGLFWCYRENGRKPGQMKTISSWKAETIVFQCFALPPSLIPPLNRESGFWGKLITGKNLWAEFMNQSYRVLKYIHKKFCFATMYGSK